MQSQMFNTQSIWEGLLGCCASSCVSGWASSAPVPVDEHGWHTYIGDAPDLDVLVEFKQKGHGDRFPGKVDLVWVGYARDLHPESNVADLYWRYTGIGKMQRGEAWMK